MEIAKLGIHESVEIDFPASILADELANVAPNIRIVGDDPTTLTDCDAVVTFEHVPEFLDAGLAWVHTTSAGVDAFPIEQYAANEVALTNSTGVHGTSVGETTIGLMLMLARRLHSFVHHQQNRTWIRPTWDEAFTLDSESACIVGLGTVGRGIASRARALGMSLTGVRRNSDAVPGIDEVYQPGGLHDAISGARFVVLAVPLTEVTTHMIGEAEFTAMRSDAYLVNVARGAVVDEPRLVTALQNNEIAGAALDVFAEEPLPAESPLWDLDDVIISPHAAVAEREFYRDIAELVRENLDRITAGAGPSLNRVA